MPLAFEPNLGQTDERVAFLTRGPGFDLFLTPAQAVYRLRKDGRQCVLRMTLIGANASPGIRGLDRLPGESHYLTSADAKTWLTHIPQYGRVEMQHVYRGVDLTYYGNGSQLEYDFVIAPGANPESIIIDVEGADAVEITAEGDLILRTVAGNMVWRAPVMYQQTGRDKRFIRGGYVVLGPTRVGFHVARYDRRQPLVIDPVLDYTKIIGGTGHERGTAVAVDASETAVITGWTESTNFPTTTGISSGSVPHVFVAKLAATGSSILYSTILGLGAGAGIALHGGNAYVTGRATGSFPITAGAYNDSGAGNNVFVTKLTSDGSGMVYSALFGNGASQGSSIAVDAAGNAHVTGWTATAAFSTTSGAFQSTRPTLGQTYEGDLDAFLVKLNAAGSALLYSTYLGSTEPDMGEAVAVDSSGHAYVAGSTQGRIAEWQGSPAASKPFPTTSSAYKTTFDGGANGFMTKFDPTAAGPASVVYSTLLGGDDESDAAYGVAVDASGHAYVTGTARDTIANGQVNFPLTSGAYGSSGTLGGAFVTKLNTSGSGLVYSAMIAGADGRKIALDSSNSAFVIGLVTSSSDFTPVSPLAGVAGGSLFLTKINAAGSAVDYSIYLDGHADVSVGVAVDPFGAAYVAGTAFVTGGNTEAFIAKIVTNHRPVANAGTDQNVFIGSSFTLDAIGSSDPDGDVITYVWKEGSTVVGTSQTVTLTRPQGVHTFSLTVSDGSSSASDEVTVAVETSLNINMFGLVNGTVTSDDAKINCVPGGSMCVARYSSPATVTLTATPDTGVSFTEWKFDCSGAGTCTVVMNAHHLVGAQFDVQQLTLAVSTGGNGTVTSPSPANINCGTQCSATLPYGTVVDLSAVPNSGYIFDTWSGHCSGTTSPCSLTMNANKSVNAAFKEITLDSLVVTPASATIAVGGQQAYTATGTFSDGSMRPISGDHAVEATDDFTCAILASGAVKCWGSHPYQTPTTIPAYEKAVALSAGTSHVCALFANGTVNCQGAPVTGVSTAVAIASQSQNACALLANGTIQCWSADPSPGTPVTVTGISTAIAIGAEGGGSACAVLADRTVQCWGGLGDGSDPSSTPAAIAGINTAVAVAVGAEHACALLSDGTVKCWWGNTRGQLGDGSVFSSTTPPTNTPVSVINVTGAISIVAGDYHSCALLSNGTVKCWGIGFANGSSIDSSTPVTIAGLSNPAAIAAGAYHNCATFANGMVSCWGLNLTGQLGVGNPGSSTTPLAVNGLTNVLNLSWSSDSAAARMMASGRAIADSAGMPTITATAGSLSATASLTIVNTPAGTNVVTQPIDTATGGMPVTVTFSSVTSAGSTTLTSSASGPTTPAGFQLGNPARYYELTTTATYTPPIEVCISYSGITFAGQPQLFHYETGAWMDVTTSVDTVNQIVCGDVTSLSPFALFEPTPACEWNVTAKPDRLWPANHKMQLVTLSVSDLCDASRRCRIEAVGSNEPVNGAGDGKTAPDWEIVGDMALKLRAERAGNGEGRIYTMTIRCTDAANGSSTRTATVIVPHHQ